MAKKFSQFPSASSIGLGDSVVGLKDGENSRFSFATVFSYIQSLFVPTSRKVNNKPLTADITLDADDVGAVPTTREVNGKPLSSDITLDASDVGAYELPSGGIPKADLAQGVQDSLDAADSAYQLPSGGIPNTDLDSAVQTSLGLADTAYQLPAGGMPSSDMASAVQTSLDKADTAYQKPSGGIPASDLASGVIPTVPPAYTSNPAMDGTASPGSSGAWARGNHVHPSDTSRAATETISQTEDTTTATRNYEVGDRFLLMLNGGLYRVTAPVSIGETLIVNTNCARVTVGTELGNSTLLYTNPSPAASFASQNIGLNNLVAYNFLLIYYKVEKSGGIYDTILIPRSSGASVGPMHIYWAGSSAMVVGYRPFTVDVANSRLSCGSGYYRGVSAASATADDGYMIPVYIWGIKILGGTT